MAQTKTLRFRSYWEGAISSLWSHINRGWSVVSASYLNSKKEFTIELTEKDWPDVTIPCCSCSTEHLPKDLMFKPSPNRLCYCSICNTTADQATE